MFSPTGLHRIALCCATTGLVLCCQPASLADSGKTPRDNSGRQIAVVVPGMPHPAGVAPLTNVKLPAIQPGAGFDQSTAHVHSFKTHVLSGIATPTEVSPEVKAAVERGALIAQGLSKIAIKRVSDFATWMAILWRHMNELPLITPSNPLVVPEPSISQMQPIGEPGGKTAQLFYTNEHRMRTVVGR